MEVMTITISVRKERNPKYEKGGRYCPACDVTFYPEPENICLKRCLFCGHRLRSMPRKSRGKKNFVKRIDPSKYGIVL